MTAANNVNGYKVRGTTDGEGPPSAYHDLSSRHADWALSSLMEAANVNPHEKAAKVEAAHTYALLAVRDKLDEFVSVAKDIRDIMAAQRTNNP